MRQQRTSAGIRQGNATLQSQTSDGLRRHTVRPDEIRPGDWLRDLGTLRHVAAVEQMPSAFHTGRVLIVYFVPQPGIENLALGIDGALAAVTIWREP